MKNLQHLKLLAYALPLLLWCLLPAFSTAQSIAQITSPFEQIRIKMVVMEDSVSMEEAFEIVDFIEAEYWNKTGITVKVRELVRAVDPFPELAFSFDGAGFFTRFTKLRPLFFKLGIPWITIVLVSPQHNSTGVTFSGVTDVCFHQNGAFGVITAGGGLDLDHVKRVVRHEIGHALGAPGDHVTGTVEPTIMNGDGENFSVFSLMQLQSCVDAALSICKRKRLVLRRDARRRCKRRPNPKRCLRKKQRIAREIYHCA